MGGRRTTKQELLKLETLTEEGLTTREIAQKLGRSPAAIRNLRYKKHLVAKLQDESKTLFQQREHLRNELKTLEERKTTLTRVVADLESEKQTLENEKQKLEKIIPSYRLQLQLTLRQALIDLKQQNPDLFTLTGEEQIAKLIGTILGKILT
jgi:IS30 family transposase